MTSQEMLDIASRHLAAMSDATSIVIVCKAQTTGESLRGVPTRRMRATLVRECTQREPVPIDVRRRYAEWNSDTRDGHC